ncbi:ATP-binding protein [Asaia prunellae]|uniref:ATP-binding protein n=1 Tax=Asaia prunellae TaxID=610245 RepID=UPI000AB96FB4|nr:ATP-binding protein [Asaia prunellae]
MTGGLASAAITAGAVAIAAAMIVRSLSTPLRALAEVADSIAKSDDTQWTMLDERGPREVRGLAHAINKMQHRIHRLISDRTEILAAVSHDLRTPLARLRLRAGFMDDEETQAAIEADIDEMEAMVTGALAYLAGDLDPEPVKQVDLVAILNTLLDSQSDRGRDTSYTGPDRCQAWVRPLAIKRVFANLIDNACNYGGNAHVTFETTGQNALISVIDDGPGIPEAELEKVLSAFYRVEGSRSRATGGMGLGLAIVTREVGRARGTVDLHNVPGRGLCVQVTLPLGVPEV